jgi:hypothetical protein
MPPDIPANELPFTSGSGQEMKKNVNRAPTPLDKCKHPSDGDEPMFAGRLEPHIGNRGQERFHDQVCGRTIAEEFGHFYTAGRATGFIGAGGTGAKRSTTPPASLAEGFVAWPPRNRLIFMSPRCPQSTRACYNAAIQT